MSFRSKRWLLPPGLLLLVVAVLFIRFSPRTVQRVPLPYIPGPVTATVWDEVGVSNRLVSTREGEDWRKELNRGLASPHRQAVLHLRRGEFELSARSEPAKAEWHFRKARRLTKPSDPLHGEAIYHQAVAQYYRCDYTHATKTFRALIDPHNGLTGFNAPYAALWLKHAEACEGYHDSHAALGIPQPPSLDPECGAAALAMCRKVLGLPHDRTTILPSIRITGRGSSNRDIVAACDKLGDVVGTYHVAADPKSLKSLPKPLIAFVEHDHFVAVLKADDTGVTYSCSDCGAWPGGEVTLSWKQWKALEASDFIAVSAAPKGLAGVPHGLAGIARSLGVAAVGQQSDDFPARNCGFDIESLRCIDASSCPSVDGGRGQGGASCGDPVNLSTLEEEFAPEPDLVVYNPTGPSVVWKRMYHSMRGYGNPQLSALLDPETPLGTGWSHPYNAWVRFTGDDSPRWLVLPNGARIQFTRPTPRGGIVACNTVGGGLPIRVYEHKIVPQWDSGTSVEAVYQWFIHFADGSVWTTSTIGTNTLVGTIFGNVPVNRITDRNGNFITMESGNPGESDAYFRVRRGDTGQILLNVQGYETEEGHNVRVSDCYGRNVFYVVENRKIPMFPLPGQGWEELRLLTKVSYVTRDGLLPTTFRSEYGYGHVPSGGNKGLYCMMSHTVPSPTGVGTETAYIRYQTDGTMSVKQLEDGYGNITRFKKVTPTKTKVEHRAAAGRYNGTDYDPTDQTVLVTSYTSEFNNHMSETGRTDATNTHTIFQASYGSNARKPDSVSDGTGKTTTFTYDNFGRTLTTTSPYGVTVRNVYETNSPRPFPRLIQVQNPVIGNTSIDYHGDTYYVASVHSPSPTGSGSVTASFDYDSLGNVSEVTTPGPNGNAVTQTFNYYGIGPDGNYATRINQPRTITDGTGAVVARMNYDTRGNLISVTDGANRTVSTEYNDADQPIRVYYPEPANPTNPFPDHVSVDYLYEGGPATWTRLYDNLNHVVREYKPKVGKEGESLGPGNSANTRETFEISNDPAYRVGTVTHANQTASQYTYDAAGRVAQVASPAGLTTYLQYDGAGRPLAVRDASGVITRYEYNTPDGALSAVSFTEADGTTTNGPNSKNNATFTYDNYGRMIGKTDGTGTVQVQYASSGGMVKSVTTQYNGPLVQSAPLSIPLKMEYAYNADGSRRVLKTPAGDINYSYDSLGRMIEVRNFVGQTQQYQYRPTGTDTGELKKIVTKGSQLPNVLQVTTTTDLGTDYLGRISNIHSYSYQELANISPHYDTVGNVDAVPTSVRISIYNFFKPTHQYTYDMKDRLTGHTSALVGGNFTYDVMGNPTTFEGTGGLTYNNRNQRTGPGYAYDANGDPTLHNGRAVQFDCLGNMVSAASALYGHAPLTLGYSISGQRVFKGEDPSNPTYFLYDGINPVCEVNKDGQVVALNTFGGVGLISRTTFNPGSRTAQNQPSLASAGSVESNAIATPVPHPCDPIIIDGVIIDDCGWWSPSPSPSPSPSTSPSPSPSPSVSPSPSPTPEPPPYVASQTFYVFDERGNVVQRINENGDILSAHQYWAYGREVGYRAGDPLLESDPWGFGAQSGYYTDNEAGYIYCTFRYYDPKVGRWLNQDPIGYAGGQNLYGYCGQNPVMGTDPLGLYTDFRSYAGEVGQVFKGYGKALNGAFNPIEMANGVAQLATVAGGCGFGAAGNMLAQGVIHSFTDWLTTDDPETFGESFGNVLITVGSELAPHASCIIKCFVEGTPVWMADGTTKPIEQVKEGDQVLSFDESAGKVVANKVVQTFARESDAGTVSVTVLSADGRREVIECTADHPLFVPGRGWTQAGDLGIGTSIVTRAGPNAGEAGMGEIGTARVVSVTRHPSRRVIIHNFEVENTHTYFVGKVSGGIWAHNTCGKDGTANLIKQLSKSEQNALGDVAEAVWRKDLERQGIELEPKGNAAEGGPDAVRSGGIDAGWDWAELKPNSRTGRRDGGVLIRKRYRNGATGESALYVYDTEGGGAFVFKRAILRKPRP